MKRVALVSIAVGFLAGLLATNSPAAAEQTMFPPSNACQWTDDAMVPANYGWIDYEGSASAGAQISCGLPEQNDVSSSSTDDITVWATDNNAGSLMQHSLYCNQYSSNYSGSVTYNESTKFLCSTSGGCASFPASWTGSGYLEFVNVDKASYGWNNLWCTLPADSGTASRLKGIWQVA